MSAHIVRNWRRRFADHGPDGRRDRLRAAQKADLRQGDKTSAPWRFWGALPTEGLADVDVQCVRGFPLEHNIDIAARKSRCESNDPEFAAKAADAPAKPLCASTRKPSIQASERAQGYLKLPKPTRPNRPEP